MKIIAYRSALVAISAVAASIATIGAGVASADSDPLIGKTYSDASATISDWKMDAVVSTVFGSELETDDCIVTSWRKSSYVHDDNFDHPKSVLVSLNCNEKLAAPGAPGNSLASPAGRAQEVIEERAERYNSKPWRCSNDLVTCKRFCENSGLCSKEIMALF